MTLNYSIILPNCSIEAISNVLDSLEEMQYLTDYFDSDCNFLDEVFGDKRIQSLLEVFSDKNYFPLPKEFNCAKMANNFYSNIHKIVNSK